MTCCAEPSALDLPPTLSVVNLLLILLFNGLVGSFTHCIGMCGPIAVAQMSMRLMNVPKDQMSQKSKLLCAASIPYYIGKAISYSLLAMFWHYISTFIKNDVFRMAGAFLMMIAALFFLASVFHSKLVFLAKLNSSPVIIKLNSFLLKASEYIKSDLKGFKGWVLGMILGLIPCGLLYSSMMTAIAYSSNVLITGLALFLFGLGTIPGLFMVAYLGEYVLIKWAKIFDIVYSISMLLNSYLLMRAAIRFVSLGIN